MSEYIKAFHNGIMSAEIAHKNRQIIQSVFNELNQQLSQETNNKIRIEIKEYDVQKGILELYRDITKGTHKKETYHAVIALNPTIEKSPEKILAKWYEDRSGFPCKIVYGDQILICEDKEALEKSITQLLEDPVVGASLFSLLNLPPAEEIIHND